MKIEDIYNLFLKNSTVSTDSRNIIPGSIFFALKGDNFDGNQYASDAITKGASYAVIDNPSFNNNEKCILVDDVLSTLQKLANYHRKQLNLKVIAITGTNGKTTTKELFAAVFSKKFNISYTKGNLNNHIGVPITLLSMNKKTEIGIVEMGANHIGEIKHLCKIAEPDFGLITNIGKAHLEGFGSFDGVIKAKTELYNYISNTNGTVFYNADNAILEGYVNSRNFKTVSYGASQNASCKGRLLASDPYLILEILSDKHPVKINTNLAGNYNFENTMAAICAGLYFNIPIDHIKTAISEYIPSNNRSQLVEEGENKLLLDYYNANPTSMEAAIKNFNLLSSNNLKKVLILGEMLELGDDTISEHKKIVELVKSLEFKEVYFVGKGFSEVHESFPYFETSEILKEHLSALKIKKAFILVKGSRGVKMEKILDSLR
jgi:UDP-N-acetylmuramoyl-tripeptide--D-alanyl-D-alanine ligase